MLDIEAIVCCVNYSDFLEVTLPHNMQFFKRMLVVTDTKDRNTYEVCRKFSVPCIRSDVFYEDGDAFNKGRGINLGIQNSRNDCWMLHLDADVLLPHNFLTTLNKVKLQKDCIYGVDRLNTLTYENWVKGRNQEIPQHQWRYLVHAPTNYQLGDRIVHMEYGWIVIGFFQLWHSSMRKLYPIVCGSAEHSDVLFSIQWSEEKRHLIPHMFVTHLESENLNMGANWKGRKTKLFGNPKIRSEKIIEEYI